MKKVLFVLFFVIFSFSVAAKIFSGGPSFIDTILINARSHEVGSNPSEKTSNLLRVGETDLFQAVIAGDIDAFRKVLRKTFLGPADVFLANWLAMTGEGDMLFHLLGKVPEENRKEFAYELHRITEVLTFPTEIKARGQAFRLHGVNINTPWLERTPLVKIITEGEPIEVFYEEIRRLLSEPVENLLGILHSETKSKQTLNRLISEEANSSGDQTKYEKYAAAIDFLREVFRMPLYHRNQKNLLPMDVAKKVGNVQAYYVLREATKDVNKGVAGTVALGAAWVSALEAGALLTLENGEVLNNMADKLGMEPMSFLGMALAGQILVPLAGMGCYLFFQSQEEKNIIQNLEPPSAY